MGRLKRFGTLCILALFNTIYSLFNHVLIYFYALSKDLPPTFNGLSSSHDVFSRKGDSPSRAFEKSDNPSTTELCTTHACVKSGNISTSDVPDLLVNVLNNKAGATGLLCGSWNPPNYTKSDAKMTSSDEFDFDDHEPDTYSCQK